MVEGRSGRHRPPHYYCDPSENLLNHQESAALLVGGTVAMETQTRHLHCSHWLAASQGFEAKVMAHLLAAETKIDKTLIKW